MGDEKYMRLALDLARRGEGFVSPNPMVGAVVVKDGRIVGQGFHQAAGKAHAEVNALDEAGEAARNATLFVTLEPCNHTGRTPPCTDRILKAGVRRVVTAMRDPNPHVAGGGLEHLSGRGLEVENGVCHAAAARLNEAYIKHVCTGVPFVTVKCAATLDGQIATRSGDAKWVSGEKSRQYVHRMRHASDAIMVGVDTVKKDDPSLTTRIEGFQGKDPQRFILDTQLSIPEGARVLKLKSSAVTTIVAGPAVAEEKKARLERNGIRVLAAPLAEGLIDLGRLVQTLGAEAVTSLLIEGGGRVIASALKAGIVDKVVVFFAPKLMGGNDGVPMCRGPGPIRMQDGISLRDVQVQLFDQDVMIEAYVRR